MNQKLKKLITQKLEKLQKYLDKMDDARVIDSDDPDTWDADTLYNLAENLQETLQLLEDKKLTALNSFSEPIIEPGLCSLVDEYQENNEEDDED